MTKLDENLKNIIVTEFEFEYLGKRISMQYPTKLTVGDIDDFVKMMISAFHNTHIISPGGKK